MRSLDDLATAPRHAVIICGAAVSGAEAAAAFAARGIAAIVFEQNARPYGKIEDGLPRWHDALRKQEYGRIDENLAREGVFFVPETALGRDLGLDKVRAFGLNAVVLANGAWRDRPLELPGVDAYVDKGLVYQNPFVYWFNHYEGPGYAGPRYEVSDGAIVIGGGLASVDVIKILNIELYRNALARRGHAIDVVEMEHRGIAKTLESFGVTREQLGVHGCTLYYRRRVMDMPLASPKDDTPEALAKTQKVREKMVQILAQKFFTRVVDRHLPVRAIVEGGRLSGIAFKRTDVRDGKLVTLEDPEVEVRAPLVVSSIGSVPRAVSGVPMKGELYDFADWDTGALRGLEGVFGLGNVLTGKGNIKDSRENSRDVSGRVLRDYLGIGEPAGVDPVADAHAAAHAQAEVVAASVRRAEPIASDRLRAVAEAVRRRWQAVGYDGDYRAWIARHRPAD
jgi:NADPH-dependent glutamate synthase beta subunit-like oxidoreductase